MEFNEHVETQNATKLNNLINAYKKFDTTTISRIINNTKRFIMTIDVNTEPLLKFEYYIVGSFDKKRNVWLWANNSTTLDKSLVSQVVNLQDALKKDTTHQLNATVLKKYYTIILTDDFKSWLGSVADYLNRINQNLITLNRSDRYIDILVAKQIIYSACEL